MPTELYTTIVAPIDARIVGAALERRRRCGTGASVPLVSDLKLTLRRLGSAGGVLRSFRVSFVVGIGTKTCDGGLVVVVVVLVVVVVVVVVVPPLGVLDGSAGSLPASSSSRSRKPSSSRSMPMRVPEPGGTQV